MASNNKSRLYHVWQMIKQRCYNKNNVGYRNYGGRGITVCDEWKDSFLSFKEWAINNGYDESLSIDRIDNNGNYEPKNCRWVTRKQQARNRNICRFITYGNETKCLSEWAEGVGITPSMLSDRLRGGWSMEDALNMPKGSKYLQKQIKKITQSLIIGKNIKKIREAKEISQVELAEKVSISQAMLCQIERGTKNPSLQIAVEIAKVLGCRIEDFTGNGDETERTKKNEAS